MRKLFIAASAMLLLAGCDVKDPIYNSPHPDHGKITLTTDWTDIGTDITVPESYTVKVGDWMTTESGPTNTLDNLFDPAAYIIYVWNTTENVVVTGTSTAGAMYQSGALGWFFTSRLQSTVQADTHHNFTAAMAQQVREFTLRIEPTGGTIARIASITGTLSGVASTLDFDSGSHGDPTEIPLTFSKIGSGADAGKYGAAVRLLGIAGSSQKLGITVTYNDGSPADQLQDYELGSLLAGFNADKKTPLTLGGQIVETPTETGFTATINAWQEVDGGSGTAN